MTAAGAPPRRKRSGRAALNWWHGCWATASPRLRAAQGVLACAKRYGAARLEAACERALAHDSPHYRTVKTILASGADQQPMAAPETPAAYRRARFTRSAAELFDTGTTLH